MCGFIHSTLVTMPENFTGLVSSYSAAKEWWARMGSVPRAKPSTRAANDTTRTDHVFISRPPDNGRISRVALPAQGVDPITRSGTILLQVLNKAFMNRSFDVHIASVHSNVLPQSSWRKIQAVRVERKI